MGSSDYFADGQWDIICDRCGQKIKSSEAKKTYDGYYTCQRCWYPRHPQEFNQGVKDDQSVPFTRPGQASISILYDSNYNIIFDSTGTEAIITT